MKSRIFHGQVMHARKHPVSHHFRYPVLFYMFDLEELDNLSRNVRFFSHNAWNVVSIHDKDFLKGQGTIRHKLLAFLSARGYASDIVRVELLTSARYFNYVFNPVSFYYCYDAGGAILCVVAEVNNTFKEKHLYILDEPTGGCQTGTVFYEHVKEFHVSPFMTRDGFYRFRFSGLSQKVTIQINLIQNGELKLLAQLSGQARPLTSANLLGSIFRYPVSAALTVPRITWQAAQLYFRKKLPFHTKPHPSSPMTIGTAPPTRLERGCLALIRKYMARLKTSNLEMILPGDESLRFGSPMEAEPASTMRIHNYRIFRKMVTGGSVGFGESFVDRDWDSDDPAGVLSFFASNLQSINQGRSRFSFVPRVMNRARHALRRNTRRGSDRNIHTHYDLSNDFYQVFLDDSMMYSCAVFEKPQDTLEEAQHRKNSLLLKKIGVGSDDHILEIGCGWGGFALQAVRETGCKVTAVTISKEQLRLARERARAAGLEKQIDFQLADYRDLTGKYNKIVSIEMLEAVGHQYWGLFFKTCQRLLRQNGKALLQVITIPDERYRNYRRNPDWIQKHIFPGGMLPSIKVLTREMMKSSDFVIEHLENIGPHYARTLREWRLRFEQNWESIRELGFDERFRRMWNYYFCYCEAGFEQRVTDNYQLLLDRSGK